MSPAGLTGPDPVVRRRVLIHGHVQGVGYRASCAGRAVRAGVGGWVRNVAGGAVEAVFEGNPHTVDELLRWCGDGPALARVTRVEVVEEEPVGDTRFSIR